MADKDYTELIEQYEKLIYNAIDIYCIDDNIDDLKKESQSVFYAVLRYINKTVFHGNTVFKLKDNISNIYNNIMPTNYNSYDFILLDLICDLYIDLCLRYIKECTVIGYSFITGIEYSTITNWKYRKDDNKLTPQSWAIFQKLVNADQETLFSRLYSGGVNPVGIFGIGKQRFGWDDKRTEQVITVKHTLSAADLPRLKSGQNLQIVDNSQQIVDNARIDQSQAETDIINANLL